MSDVKQENHNTLPKQTNATEKELICFIKTAGFYKQMDANNKAAADVMEKEGSKAAVTHMMSNAGMDYGSMRMMYG